MHIRISIGDMTLPTYSMIVLLGIIAVTLLGILTARHRKLDTGAFFKLECIGGAAAFLGAKTWKMIAVIVFAGVFAGSDSGGVLSQAVSGSSGVLSQAVSGSDGVSLQAFSNSGVSFWGGMLCGLLAVFAAAALLRVDFHSYAKNLIFLVPLLHGIWKVGCFMGGCCYGVPYSGPGAVVFPEGVPAPAGIPLFPVQLVEAGISFAMALVFYCMGRRAEWRHPVATYLGTYAALRFGIEFLRFHKDNRIVSGTHGISAACMVAVILYVRYNRNNLKE